MFRKSRHFYEGDRHALFTLLAEDILWQNKSQQTIAPTASTIGL